MAATGFDDRRRWVLAVLDEYEVPLTRFATRLLADEEAARDVVQHVFLRLCDQQPEELHERIAPWLFTVCRNKALDALRVRGQTASIEGHEDRASFSREPDPAGVVEMKEIYRRLSGLLDSLPDAQREAVGLWSQGFSYREIAEITGHGEGNVRVQVHRALKHLRGHPLVQRLLGSPAETDRIPHRTPSKFV